MFIIKIILLFLTSASIALAGPSTLKKDMDDVISHAIHDKRIVGTVVVISYKGKIIYEGAYGWSDRQIVL